MISVSLAMIVCNDEAHICKNLDEIQYFADEIIIVDTGSTDNTKWLAKKYTNLIFDYPWEQNFADARNFSFSKATKDYIFWLNADEIITPESLEKLNNLKNALMPDVDIVYMQNIPIDENTYDIEPYYNYRARLVKRENGYVWLEPTHEYILAWGKKLFTDITIRQRPATTHSIYRDIAIYENCLQNQETLSTRSAYYFSNLLKSFYEFL